MAKANRRPSAPKIDYPTEGWKVHGETAIHGDDMMDLIQSLHDYFAADPMICVSGNMLIFYEEGNRIATTWKCLSISCPIQPRIT